MQLIFALAFRASLEPLRYAIPEVMQLTVARQMSS